MYDVIISGAGPTGLMLSLWLQRKGLSVLTVDKGEGPTTESRALGVQARTLETYDMLGIGGEALGRGQVAESVTYWLDGEPGPSLSFPEMGKGISPHPYLFLLSQAENEAILYEALKKAGGDVRWGCEVTDFEDRGDSVRVSLGEEEAEASYLCGCDGVGSVVRKRMLGDFPGGTYEGLFFVADATLEESLGESRTNVSIESDGIFLAFPMVGERGVRLIGDVPEHSSRPEEMDLEVLSRLSRSHFGVGVESTKWVSTYKVHHRVARHFQKGRVFLLGDAAHVHSPAGGQGMNTGLLDSANLGWKLAAVVKRGASQELLRTYSFERMPFAHKLLRSTDAAFGVVSAKSFVARLLRRFLVPTLFKLADRFSFLQRFLFRQISQTSIEYRHSPLSRDGDLVGSVQAGDRLPWVDDNFDALVSCDWQVHIYGDSFVGHWDTVPVHRFPYGEKAAEVGLLQDAAYLIRPDGYVGLVLQDLDGESLDQYLERWAGTWNS